MNHPSFLRRISYFFLVFIILFVSGCMLREAPQPADSSDVSVVVKSKVSKVPTILPAKEEVGAQSFVKGSKETPSDLPWDSNVLTGTLSNGMRWLVMKNSEPKGRVSMHLAVASGSLNETDKEQGAAHFLEHMLFNGSEHFPPGELIKYFQRIGMSFGSDANAHTGFFETVYDVVLQEGSKKSLAEGLLVMRDYAAGALLLESEVDRERGVILAEKRDRDSISYRNQKRSIAFELPGVRVNQRHPIGLEETIKVMDSQILRGYYNAWYRPKKMAVVVVGDMNPADAVGLIKERFEDLLPRVPKKEESPLGHFSHKGFKVFYAFNPEAGSTTVTLEVLRHHAARPDTFETRRRALILSMASQILENRLDDRIGKEGTPFTSAGVGMGTFMREVDYGVLTGECQQEMWKETLAELDQALRSALLYGFSKEEVDRVKKERLNALIQGEKKAPTRNSRDLAATLVGSFTRKKVVVSPEDRRRLFEPVIASVTPQELAEALRLMWHVDHRLVLVEGNLKLDESQADQTILTAYKTSRAIPAKKPMAQAGVGFPYLSAPKVFGRVATISEPEKLGVKVVTFENGLVLNLKKTDFKKGEVLYALEFGRGLSRSRGVTPGLGNLASMVVEAGGLGKLTREETARALAGTNTSFSYVVDQGRFSISGASTPEESGHLMQILFTMVTDTQLKEEAFQLSKKRFSQALDEMGRTVDGVLGRDGEAFLTGDEARFGAPSQDRLAKMGLGDVKRMVMPALETAPLELSIVGDFNEKEMIALCGKWLGSLPRRVELGASAVSLRFPKGKRLERQVATEIERSEVVVGWLTTDMWDIHKARRLSVLGGLFRERLRETVREKLGVAYSPSAWNQSSSTYRNYGVLRAVVSVAPDKSDEVIEAVTSIADGLRGEKATADEVQRVVDPLVNRIADYRRTNVYWLESVMRGSSLKPEKFKWATDILTDYGSVTAEELQVLARNYLKTGHEAVIVVSPKKRALKSY
ncbi:MAG: insulinase family protein [Desulfobacterales bacterium]|nr:insulinase family protein [Desulfobacterales bacterium]